MKTVGNILWFIFTGLISGFTYFFAGLIWCITIIGIPFGKQFFKLSRLMFWPFGKTTNSNFSAHPVANTIWIIFGGLLSSLGFFVAGVFWCITILGIPFGKQCFKLGKLALAPFGATIQ